MSKNNQNSDRIIANKFDMLFASIPELRTEEETDHFLNEMGFVPNELEEKGARIVAGLLENNWRFVPEETIERQRAKLFSKEIRTDLPRQTIIERIQNITQALAIKGLGSSLTAGVAHRNLERESTRDLASLLRQLEHVAEEEGIDLGD